MLAAGPGSDPAGVQPRSVTPLTPGSALTRPAPRCLTSRVTELDVVVDPASREAPFEQVRAQVEAQIRSGRLVPGDRLPTVRALAADLGLAANTVARAFKELEAAGLVETRRRAGTVVASGEHTADVASWRSRRSSRRLPATRGSTPRQRSTSSARRSRHRPAERS